MSTAAPGIPLPDKAGSPQPEAMMAQVGFKGGAALEARLKGIEQRIRRANTVEVGFMEDASEADGTPVAYVALINEFGGTFTVPAHDVSIYRKLKANGDFARGGKFVRKDKANIETTHHVASYTVTVPSRPFFRNMIAAHKGEWGQNISNLLQKHNYDAVKALDDIGEEIQGQLVDSIDATKTPRNAPSTIASKGFDDPLVDTNTMRNSAAHRVITE